MWGVWLREASGSTSSKCTRTAVGLRLLLINGGHILPRLSVDISGSEALCCKHPNFPFRNARAVKLLCSLQGYWLKANDQSVPTYIHFSGLTDLSFVVGSNITHMPPETVDYKCHFRPAVTNGVSSGEIIFKHLNFKVRDLVVCFSCWILVLYFL